jgi:hypothetical protein
MQAHMHLPKCFAAQLISKAGTLVQQTITLHRLTKSCILSPCCMLSVVMPLMITDADSEDSRSWTACLAHTHTKIVYCSLRGVNPGRVV